MWQNATARPQLEQCGRDEFFSSHRQLTRESILNSVPARGTLELNWPLVGKGYVHAAIEGEIDALRGIGRSRFQRISERACQTCD
jgi:hypothetical protein